jgi:WXG100 family type VII secretion target
VSSRFRIQPDQLSDLVERMSRFGVDLERALEQVESRVNQLHGTWSGPAAEAQRAAHDEWKRGAAEMREALDMMRRIASTAHGNYTEAAAANLSMWEQAAWRQ